MYILTASLCAGGGVWLREYADGRYSWGNNTKEAVAQRARLGARALLVAPVWPLGIAWLCGRVVWATPRTVRKLLGEACK